MIEEPVLIETAAGPIAAVVTGPDDAPVGGVMVFVGSGGTRSGANQIWTRLARTLSSEGIATLRADYAGVAESSGADARAALAASRDLGRWFADRLGGAGIVLVGQCYGLTPSWAICRDGGNVLGLALIVPPLYPPDAAPASRRRRLHLRLARVRHWRARRKSGWWEDVATDRALLDVVRVAPTWILTGTGDKCLPPLTALLPSLKAAGTVELEISDVARLNGSKTPEAQAAILEGVTTWIHRCIRSVGERV